MQPTRPAVASGQLFKLDLFGLAPRRDCLFSLRHYPALVSVTLILPQTRDSGQANSVYHNYENWPLSLVCWRRALPATLPFGARTFLPPLILRRATVQPAPILFLKNCRIWHLSPYWRVYRQWNYSLYI